MIAWLYPQEEETLIAQGRLTGAGSQTGDGLGYGEWVIRYRHDRDDLLQLMRHELEERVHGRKGFRTPPLNPGKRIRSMKSKKRRSR
jgi:hypothetical protein